MEVISFMIYLTNHSTTMMVNTLQIAKMKNKKQKMTAVAHPTEEEIVEAIFKLPPTQKW